MSQTLFNEHQAAEFLNIAASTLRKWRFQGRGPEYRKIGGRLVRYPLPSLSRWIESQSAGGERAEGR